MTASTFVQFTSARVAGFTDAAAAEWLVTNGIGGFAAGTVANACTRRYHGLLVAALRPPVQRTVLVAKCDCEVSYDGTTYALGANEYVDGTINPHGYRYLESFRLDGLIPEWIYAIKDLRLRTRVWMAHGENTTYVSFEVLRASAPVVLEIHPLCAYRDYHAHGSADITFDVKASGSACKITAGASATPYRIEADVAVFKPAPGWHWRLLHRIERERGLDDEDTLFRPGIFRSELEADEAVTLTFSTQTAEAPALALRRERGRQSRLLGAIPPASPAWIRQLCLAADQFIVTRGGRGGASVIAGYPWFADWGRDTMIALPGLTLALGRHDVARQILTTFAGHVSEGMLPNRFPDDGEAPEYNTVDATLWFFHAVDAYLEASADHEFGASVYPVLANIIECHVRGTRYGIRVDPRDELLAAGVDGVQLTWMDAKVGDWVVTPRRGKPVEINALWQRALTFMARLANKLGYDGAANNYAGRARRHAVSFAHRFWYADGAYLYDVVDAPGGIDDTKLRPNQIFAVALADDLLDAARCRAVVDVCVRELWTPYGLRSLAPGHSDYRGRYDGGPRDRDAVYHQGTVWSWLLGPLARAHFKVHRDADAALALLQPIERHLMETGLGSISEIFDGDTPHAARGCFAQAWSVAEVLHAWFAINAAGSAPQQQERHP